MSVDVRYIQESEFPDFVRVMFWAAGRPVDDAFIAERRRCTDLEGALALFDDGRLVGTLGMRKLTMRLPGGAIVPMVALGQGGVLPEYASRGHSLKMVNKLFADAREQGIAIGGGTMAEWPGFGRFGWGPATYSCSYEIETRRVRFRSGQLGNVRCELVSSNEALEVLPALHAKSAEKGTNLVPRDAQYWSVMVERLDRGESLDFLSIGASHPPPFYCLCRNEAGEPEGLAIYRITPKWEHGLSRTSLELIHFIHSSSAAHAGMWKHLLSLALVEKIYAPHSPVDDPIIWRVVEGRRVVNTGTYDHIWLRLLNLPAALESRGSGMLSRSVTVRVVDEYFRETNTCVLSPDNGRLHVQETTADPDIETDTGVVAGLFLGGTQFRPFVDTNRIQYKSEAALWAFASIFAGTSQPFVDSEF